MLSEISSLKLLRLNSADIYIMLNIFTVFHIKTVLNELVFLSPFLRITSHYLIKGRCICALLIVRVVVNVHLMFSISKLILLIGTVFDQSPRTKSHHVHPIAAVHSLQSIYPYFKTQISIMMFCLRSKLPPLQA